MSKGSPVMTFWRRPWGRAGGPLLDWHWWHSWHQVWTSLLRPGLWLLSCLIMRSAPRWAASGPEWEASKRRRLNVWGTTSCTLSWTCLTKIPSRILTVGRWDQRILDSSGSARKSLRLGVMSCSRKLSTGAIDGSSSCKFLRSAFEYSEQNWRARIPRGAMHSFALSNSSIQGCGEWFAYTLFTNGTGNSIRVAMNSTWAVFDDVVELGKCFNPSCQDSFRSFKCFKPF